MGLSPESAAAAARSVLLPDLLVVEDLASVLRITPSAARKLLRRGVIPGRRIGRRWVVDREALLRSLTGPDANWRILDTKGGPP